MEETDAGLEAAVRYWVDLQNHALATGETGPWTEFSAADCRYCRDMMDDIERIYGSGGRIDGGRFSAVKVWASTDAFDTEDGEEAQAMATLRMERSAGTAYTAAGEVAHRYGAVSCANAEENWDQLAYDENGDFVGTICELVVPDPSFDEATGWQGIGAEFGAQ